jgi:hypothetical protein
LCLLSGDLVCEPCETSGAVAAHLRFPAISVKVTHPKIRAVGWLFEQQDAVGAYAPVPITQLRDLGAIQSDASCPVIKQDEIVPGAIHFCETQHAMMIVAAVFLLSCLA